MLFTFFSLKAHHQVINILKKIPGAIFAPSKVIPVISQSIGFNIHTEKKSNQVLTLAYLD
ncbi:hypothetical protein C6H68_22350 [Photorhabdus luminescens]|nr:hypothetical protein C6H68_22350 [Photorhabdus luminescens]